MVEVDSRGRNGSACEMCGMRVWVCMCVREKEWRNKRKNKKKKSLLEDVRIE